MGKLALGDRVRIRPKLPTKIHPNLFEQAATVTWLSPLDAYVCVTLDSDGTERAFSEQELEKIGE